MYPLYPLAYFYPPVKPLFFGKIGRIEELEFQLQKPKNNSLFFEGDVYLLIGPNTFSSANILADMIKCYQIGTVIGEETGGLTIAFGDIIPFQLSNTKLNGGCSFKKFYHPCGKSDGHGVIPDIEVKQNAADLKKGIDTVMEFTIEYIKNKH
jgi:C-terminal processing protease CtpA/Prc